MKRALVCISLMLSVLQPIESRAIENGKDASGHQYVVRILTVISTSKLSSCSGAVLSEFVIVTAAHCLIGESGLLSKEIWVLPPGASTKRDSSDAYVKESSWIRVDSTQITLTYKRASEKVEEDDLAFLVLTTPVKVDVKILIPSEDETTKLRNSNASLRLYGYGLTTDAGAKTDSPNYFDGNFDSQKLVLVKNSGLASSSDATSCRGDSGGPVLNITSTTVTLVGVITGIMTSVNCGKKLSDGKFYTLFTYLSRYANLAFSAAELSTKKAADLANQEKEKVDKSLSLAVSRYQSAEKEALDALSEVKAVKAELDQANERIFELERIIQSLQNQNKVFTAKLTITINCRKGSQIKKVTGIDPKCPKGYKKK